MPRAQSPAPAPQSEPPRSEPTEVAASALGEWLRRQRAGHPASAWSLPVRLLGLTLVGAALLGVGTWIGLSNAAKPKPGPGSLAAAVRAAQAGEFPCGPSSQLPGILSQICGGPAPSSSPARAKRSNPAPAVAANAAVLAHLFGGPVQLGVVVSDTAAGLQFRSGRVSRQVALGATVPVLQVRHSGGVLTLAPVGVAAITVGAYVLVVLSRTVTAPATAVAVYLLPHPSLLGVAGA